MRRKMRQGGRQLLSRGGKESARAFRGDPGATLHFLRALWQLNHALESASRRMKRTYGVTGPERLFIRIVGEHPGITPSELADAISVDRSTVTPLLKHLGARKIVRRSRNPVDGRSVHLTLLAAGARIDGMGAGTIESCVHDVIASSEAYDVATAVALLVRMSQRLNAKSRSMYGRRAAEGVRSAESTTESGPPALAKSGRPRPKRRRK